jgi:ABC-type nitrate/sulfonate/bicarbonate transport system permease component
MNPAIRTAWFIGSIAVTAALVFGWQLFADYSGVPPVFLPGPDRSWDALMNGIGGELGAVTLATIERMFYGWVLASIAGVLLGALIGSSKAARDYLAPTLEMIRPVPVSAFMPVVIAFTGLSGGMVLIVIAIGAIWPTLLGTVHGVANVEPRLMEVSRSLKLSRLETIWKIALPNAQADILAGARLGLTISLILAVVGEMLTSEDGLGFYILQASRAYHSDQVFAGVILLGVIGLVSNLALQAVEWRVLRWRRR